MTGVGPRGDAALQTVDLQKTYRTGRLEYPALRGVSLSVDSGEFVSIVGPSGSGKTTLMNLIGTLDRPTKGEVFIDGTPVSSLKDNALAKLRNTKLGFVFQSFNLVTYLTAGQNVELPLVAAGVASPERSEKANEMLTYLGLGDKMRKKPNELSGGEQQRVAVARALMNDPSLILADEPTGNLDTKSSEVVVSLLRDVSEDRHVTVVMITHNMEMTKFCHRVFYIRDGLLEKELTQS